jgi:hypothetical protein
MPELVLRRRSQSHRTDLVSSNQAMRFVPTLSGESQSHRTNLVSSNCGLPRPLKTRDLNPAFLLPPFRPLPAASISAPKRGFATPLNHFTSSRWPPSCYPTEEVTISGWHAFLLARNFPESLFLKGDVHWHSDKFNTLSYLSLPDPRYRGFNPPGRRPATSGSGLDQFNPFSALQDLQDSAHSRPALPDRISEFTGIGVPDFLGSLDFLLSLQVAFRNPGPTGR